MSESCGNCRFRRDDEEGNARCHRRAPLKFGVSWPLVSSDDWCGDYEHQAIHLALQVAENARRRRAADRAECIEHALLELVGPFEGAEIRDLKPQIAAAFAALRMPKEGA